MNKQNTVELWTVCNVKNIWAPSSEFVSSSIPSWQILTAHAQPFRGARDLAFCLKVPLDSLLVWASSEGSGETARMRRLAWTFAARIGDKYQIRLTRSILCMWIFFICFQVYHFHLLKAVTSLLIRTRLFSFECWLMNAIIKCLIFSQFSADSSNSTVSDISWYRGGCCSLWFCYKLSSFSVPSCLHLVICDKSDHNNVPCCMHFFVSVSY